MSVVKLDEVFIEFAIQSIENAPKGAFFWSLPKYFQDIYGFSSDLSDDSV